MTNRFQKLVDYLKQIQSRYFHALSAFYVYEGLRELADKNIVGKQEAEDNTRIINRFKNFFLPARESLRVYFLLELAKLYDVSDKSLHINKIINYAQIEIHDLTVKSFEEYNQGRELLQELVSNYKGLRQSDIDEIKLILEGNQSLIVKLKKYRDQYLAHDDLKKKEIKITQEEILKLFRAFADIINRISSNLNHESWIWSMVEESCKRDTKLVIDYLQRFEPYRLQEIEKKYQDEIN